MANYEPGKYKFRITNQGFGESPEKKTSFFFIEGEPVAQVVDGTEYQVESSYQRKISLWITEKTEKTVREKLMKVGWDGDKWATLDLTVSGCLSLVGQEIDAVCKHEAGRDNDGKSYERWELPHEGGTREPSQSDVSVARKLDAMFGKSKGSTKPANARQPRQARQTATATSGEDIPF